MSASAAAASASEPGEPAGPAPGKRCAVSIDVDSIGCYYRIHGLGPAPDALRELITARCVPRFAEMLERRGIAATFFFVARDIDPARGPGGLAARALVGELDRAGHEIASHSYSHPYELARLPADAVARELGRAHDVLGDAIGRAVTGFRAPGYDLSATVLGALIRLGYRYDSSLFPAPGYWAAKAAVMAGIAAIRAVTARLGHSREPSGAVLTDPRGLLAPAEPYRPSERAPWRRGRAPLVELPIAVTPGLRIPVIGTAVVAAPAPVRRWLIAQMAAREVFNFELHGIDLCDAEADGIPDQLIARQPDLRVPLARKRAALEAALDQIGETFGFAPLAAIAASASRTLAISA